MKRVLQKIKLDDYEIVFDEGLTYLNEFLEKKNYSQIIVLVDSHTNQHCYPQLIQLLPHLKDCPKIITPAGESNKNLNACEEIWAQMLQVHTDRKAVVLNLGGGVIGDMGGFVAACYKRGIEFIQIPTTVLSQVDASIGGKLGVDFKYGKNLIGVFKNPALVLVSTIWLKTLSKRQTVNGFAEIYKHALIQSRTQWEHLSKNLTIPSADFNKILHDSLLIKKEVVEKDPFEKDWRKILNFGHTIGHAVETYSLENDSEPLLHGEAIATGMLMEALIGTITNGFSLEHLRQMEKVLLTQFGHYQIPKDSHSIIWNMMSMDKKNRGAKVLAVVLKDIGEPVIDVEITRELFDRAVNYYRALA